MISLNLNSVPFLSSTDATRASMVAKQIQQTLTSPNQDIPYVIGSDYKYLTEQSSTGIIIAEDDGKVIFRHGDVLLVLYQNNGKLVDFYVPPVKKTYSIFGTTLRYCIEQGKSFKKGDILAFYDSFYFNIPTYGYNVFTAFFPFFGYNHEDALVISENFSERAIVTYVDKVIVPIFEYTILLPYYENKSNSFTYFPSIGQQVDEDIICCSAIPKGIDENASPTIIKDQIQLTLKKMNLSGLMILTDSLNSKLNISKIRTKVENGIVNGMKIHRLREINKIDMIDKKLQNILDKLYVNVYGKFIMEFYNTLSQRLGLDGNSENSIKKYIEYILGKYYLCLNSQEKRGNLSLKDICYLLEFEIVDQQKTKYGDKLCNRYANKGVVSLIIPDELRPYTTVSKQPIDLIFNPFGVFSRMNLGQILEILVGKPVMFADHMIKSKPEKTKKVINWLNESVIKYVDKNYYSNIKENIINRLDDNSFLQKFIRNIQETNLFIEAPCFTKVDITNLINNGVIYNETVIIPRKLIQYMKDKLNLNLPVINNDIEIPNIFCGPMYIQKLSKISSKIVNARDLGAVKSITKQPTRGRSKSGGSRLGQMEMEAIVANGCLKSLRELFSVKSDWNEGKKDLIKQLIAKGDYKLPENTSSSRTKEVVDVYIKFLKE